MSPEHSNDSDAWKDDMKVLVIGAGVAGMMAGHLLKEKGIDVEILEVLLACNRPAPMNHAATSLLHLIDYWRCAGIVSLGRSDQRC